MRSMETKAYFSFEKKKNSYQEQFQGRMDDP